MELFSPINTTSCYLVECVIRGIIADESDMASHADKYMTKHMYTEATMGQVSSIRFRNAILCLTINDIRVNQKSENYGKVIYFRDIKYFLYDPIACRWWISSVRCSFQSWEPFIATSLKRRSMA